MTTAVEKITIGFNYASGGGDLVLVVPLRVENRVYLGAGGTTEYSAEVASYYIENLRDLSEWKPLFHQTAGHGCHQHAMLAYPLQPNARGVSLIQALERKYAGSCLGMWGDPVLAEVMDYWRFLAENGLDCQADYGDLQEGLYPLDLSGISLLTDSPIDPAALLVEDDNKDFLGVWGDQFKLRILGSNCD